MKSKLVRYCPGDAIGTPGSMSPDDADENKVRDTMYLERMRAAGQVVRNWPHICESSGACPKCERTMAR